MDNSMSLVEAVETLQRCSNDIQMIEEKANNNFFIQELKKLVLVAELKKHWYTLEECAALKGGGALNTYKSIRFYQPKGGIPDGRVSGRKVWSRETVAEWLPITDDELPKYHQKYHTGATKR